mmetsp:Transcript_10021/g.16689  ORF Transcript_10021/g.16689 Transcript_10021/m.16689 type:complete len:208 (-) Transcript_10021:294-917(-)
MENLRWIVDYCALGLRRYFDGVLVGLADGFESLISVCAIVFFFCMNCYFYFLLGAFVLASVFAAVCSVHATCLSLLAGSNFLCSLFQSFFPSWRPTVRNTVVLLVFCLCGLILDVSPPWLWGWACILALVAGLLEPLVLVTVVIMLALVALLLVTIVICLGCPGLSDCCVHIGIGGLGLGDRCYWPWCWCSSLGYLHGYFCLGGALL